MTKQIPINGEIYIAPEIKGKRENGNPIVIDERYDRELDPNDIDDKIFIYEREVKEWFLNPASKLLEHDNSRFENSFIVLMVCMAYFEGVEQYKTGVESHRRSEECFKDSVRRLYPDRFQDGELKKLYTKSRCGLFHNGMVKGGVRFNNTFPEAIKFEDYGETVKINPTRLLNDIKEDFENYTSELKNANSTNFRILRENFDRLFTVL